MSSFTKFTAAIVSLVFMGIVSSASAQTYPNHPVRVIVPFAAGGPTDVFARMLAQKLSESLGQKFYVENQTGDGGNLGMGRADRTAPDGYHDHLLSMCFIVT